MTMRELDYVGGGKVAWRDRTDPEVKTPAAAIVRPIAATSCDLDRLILDGKTPFPAPFAIGHECIAEVVAVGAEVRRVRPGDRVVVPWHVSCGACARCAAGLYAHCTAVPYGAMYGLPIAGAWGGLFSDLVTVPHADPMLVVLPPALDPVGLAAAGDNWSLAYRLIAPHLAARPGARVLVVSLGSIGLYVCDIARALGASHVRYVDPDPARRAIAAGYGAEAVAASGPIPHGFDVAVECTGTVDALATALRSLVPEGICESAGNHYQPGALPLLDMYFTGVTLRVGRDNVRAHIPDALALAASGKVDPRRVVTGVFDWEALPDELPRGHTKPVFVRAA
jgi:alcohol dehydrogenase